MRVLVYEADVYWVWDLTRPCLTHKKRHFAFQRFLHPPLPGRAWSGRLEGRPLREKK